MWLSALLMTLAALCFTPWGARVLEWLSPALRRLAGRSIWLYAGIATVVFVAVRVPEPFLGDGQSLLRHLMTIGRLEARGQTFQDEGTPRWTEPLETLLHETAFRAASLFHPPVSARFSPDQTESEVRAERAWFFDAARWVYFLLSAMAGGLFVATAIRFARRRLSAESRLLFLLPLFSCASLLLFCGYLEDYAWISLAVTLTMLLAIGESAAPPRWPTMTLVAFLAALAFHLIAIIFLPAILYLVIIKGGQKTGLSKWFARARSRRVITTFSIVYFGIYLVLYAWAKPLHLLPLVRGGETGSFALLTVQHGLDLINLLLLSAPLACAVLLFAAKPRAGNPVADVFLRIASLSGVAFAVFFRSDLGMARDWDLYSVVLWPLVIFGAWKLADIQANTPSSRLAAVVAGFALLIAVPFVAANASVNPSIARFESLLRLDPSVSAYGWENLAAYYRRQNDSDGAIYALQQAVAADSNPRYKLNLGAELCRAGQLDDAQPYYLAAAKAQPRYVDQMLFLCLAYARGGENEKVKDLLRTMIQLDPQNPKYRELLETIEPARPAE